ncbi:MAG: metallophosphoesterase, partial [Clostridia bacterium]|nr:metallophosphoesterase [Clostridia bacterium]
MVIYCILIAVAAAFLVAALISTFTLRTTRLEIPIRNLPDEFDGFKLVHISDLHNASFGKNNGRLASRIKSCKPDCVLMTGDFAGGISFEHPEKGSSHKLCLALKPLPVYVSLGNHEMRLVYRHMDLFE